MRVVDVIAEILKREGVNHLNCYPTTVLIEAAAAIGIRPIVCRQERVGVGIADGFARVTNGASPSVFTMQYGPGAENAFPGISTAYSDSTPMLLLPLGHARGRDRVFPMFSSVDSYASVTKSAEQINVPERVADAMRRAFHALRNGRPGPVLVELPADVAGMDVSEDMLRGYAPVKRARAQGDPKDVESAADALVNAKRPVILAGAGVLYAEATDELRELAELLQIPVMTTMEGKSAISEANHPPGPRRGFERHERPRVSFLERRGSRLRRRHQPHRPRTRHARTGRKNHRPRDERPGRPQQEPSRRASRARGCEARTAPVHRLLHRTGEGRGQRRGCEGAGGADAKGLAR